MSVSFWKAHTLRSKWFCGHTGSSSRSSTETQSEQHVQHGCNLKLSIPHRAYYVHWNPATSSSTLGLSNC
jgi:hypothetical protein